MINKISELAKNNLKISDFHLREGSNIAYRVLGEIFQDANSLVKKSDLDELLKKNCTPEEVVNFEKNNELDCAINLADFRFRANFFKTLNGTAVVLRRIVTKIPTMEELNLPPVMYEIVEAHKGLVLVTGPTGSGKSTTLAAIVGKINELRSKNIITIEDPVEFIHHDKKSIISQREVGKQTSSFARALKSALREDPDVILVGEMRDLETLSMALTAAETGHLVFGTLHTSSAPKTVDRIIDVFPPTQQAQVRAMFAESIQGVINFTLQYFN